MEAHDEEEGRDVRLADEDWNAVIEALGEETWARVIGALPDPERRAVIVARKQAARYRDRTRTAETRAEQAERERDEVRAALESGDGATAARLREMERALLIERAINERGIYAPDKGDLPRVRQQARELMAAEVGDAEVRGGRFVIDGEELDPIEVAESAIAAGLLVSRGGPGSGGGRPGPMPRGSPIAGPPPKVSHTERGRDSQSYYNQHKREIEAEQRAELRRRELEGR